MIHQNHQLKTNNKMTDRFLKAMPYIFEHEGGYNDIKQDSGGATNFGISLSLLKSLGTAGDINHDGHVDWIDIKTLDKEHAEIIYYNNFWKPYNETLTERLSIKIFDTGVNTGIPRSVKLLQTALNACGSNIPTDGLIGPTTLAETAKYDETTLLTQYCKAQMTFYDEIVTKNPDQKKFIIGWHNRSLWTPN